MWTWELPEISKNGHNPDLRQTPHHTTAPKSRKKKEKKKSPAQIWEKR
jgi:hypothetical protein